MVSIVKYFCKRLSKSATFWRWYSFHTSYLWIALYKKDILVELEDVTGIQVDKTASIGQDKCVFMIRSYLPRFRTEITCSL